MGPEIAIDAFIEEAGGDPSAVWNGRRRLPDGVGTNGVFTEVPQIPYILQCFALSAGMGPHFAACCPHFPMKVR